MLIVRVLSLIRTCKNVTPLNNEITLPLYAFVEGTIITFICDPCINHMFSMFCEYAEVFKL